MFKSFPTVNYDLLKNGNTISVPNITLRFVIQDLIRRRKAIFYNYNIEEGERPDVVAFKYYQDATLDWVILLINNIVDPQFEWPLDRASFENFIISKYGSLQSAWETTHHYEMILQEQSVTYDGNIVPEVYVEIDETTYNETDPADRRLVTAYEYEEKVNEQKREIKVLDPKFIPLIVGQVEELFE